MDTILLVGTETVDRNVHRKTLEGAAFVVLEATNGKRLSEILQRQIVDVIVLDITPPARSSLKCIPHIRAETAAPLILFSSKNGVKDKTRGLDLGADGIIEKLVETDELIAIVRAYIRRFKGLPLNKANNSSGEANPELIRFGRWTLDQTRCQIFDEMEVSGKLTAQEIKLLMTLIENAGRVVRRRILCEALRAENYIPHPRTIDVRISRIRHKLRDCSDNPKIVKTVRGVGYMIDKNVLTG